MNEFKNEEFKPPKVFDLKDGKKILQDDKFRGRHEAVFYSGGCIVRTTKRGIEKSKQDRRDEDEGGRREKLSHRSRDSRREEYSWRRHESSADRLRMLKETRSRRRSRSRSRSLSRKKSKSDARGDREHWRSIKKRDDTKRSRSRREDERSSTSHRSESPRRRR